MSDELLLDTSFGAARARFVSLPSGGSLLAASEDAYGRGITGLAEAWPPGRVPELAGVRSRDLAAGEGSAGLALRWDARAPGGGLFPALDANLTLSQAGEQASLLSLAGTYRLPATVLAAAPSAVIADLAANVTIRAFLTRVAAGIAHPGGRELGTQIKRQAHIHAGPAQRGRSRDFRP